MSAAEDRAEDQRLADLVTAHKERVQKIAAEAKSPKKSDWPAPRGLLQTFHAANGALTVGDLIAVLQKLPADAMVATEGCDCDGDVCDVELREDHDWHTGRLFLQAYLRRDRS